MKTTAFFIGVSLFIFQGALSAQKLTGAEAKETSTTNELPKFNSKEIVVKIVSQNIDLKESLKHFGLALNFGTGYCFGQAKCDYILTNHHVADRAGSPLWINGVKVLRTYDATGPQDKDAVWTRSANGHLFKMAPVRDIAIYRLDHPIKGKHGIPFFPGQLQDGENLEVYGHPRGGKLLMIETTFFGEGGDGLLYLKAKAGNEVNVAPGISGSLVVNGRNQAVGLVQGISKNGIVAVVPVWSLADFVKSVLPSKYTETLSGEEIGKLYRPGDATIVPIDFDSESEALAKEVGPEEGVSPRPVLSENCLWNGIDRTLDGVVGDFANSDHRTRIPESESVRTLRKNAEVMLEQTDDLLAVGTSSAFGGHDPEISIQYQLRMADGNEELIRDGKKIKRLFSSIDNGIGLEGGWSEFPRRIGSEVNLFIQQADDLVLPAWGMVKVFRYEGKTEDGVAQMEYDTYYLPGLHTTKVITVPIRGEVWTDENLNILRIHEELDAPPSKKWIKVHSSILYGWLDMQEGVRKLVPTAIIVTGERTDNHQRYTTLTRITNYHQFTVSVRIGGPGHDPAN